MTNPVSAPTRATHTHRAAGDWLRPIVGDWPTAVCRELEVAAAVARVVVASVQGSSPRDPGTCMLISVHGTTGTIGGGHLEWQAIQFARDLLGAGSHAVSANTRRLVLGTQLGQCCGGVVELWIERFTRRDLPLLRSAAQAAQNGEPVLMTTALGSGGVIRRVMQATTPAFLPPQLRSSAEALLASDAKQLIHFARMRPDSAADDDALLIERLNPPTASIWLYGAGHVGQAVVRIVSELPVQITWIDARAELLPRRLPSNVHVNHARSPVEEAAKAPCGARHLVMSHDHGLDYEICRSILERNEFEWLGLIGSASKGARFRSRLRRDGIPDKAIERLVCPIGIGRIEGKAPAIIAVSVAAQLLQTLGEAAVAAVPDEAKVPDEETVAIEVPLRARTRLPRQQPSLPDIQHALGECSTDNCGSCGSGRRAHV
jgi:xanthine dehydrogenase accessory factor